MRNFCIILLFSLFVSVKTKLPSTIPVCRRSDPQLSDCILKSIKTLQPRLASGNLGPNFQIPQTDPFFIKYLSYGNDRSLKVTLTNVYIHGPSNFRIEKLRTNINDLKFDFIVTFPRVEIVGKYKFILYLLGAPLNSDGDVFTVLENPKARVSMKAFKYVQNGVEYLKFEPINLKIQRGNVKSLKMTNLFGGSPVISEIIHSLAVSNNDFLLNDVYPYIEKQFSATFTDIANRIAAEATFDELFPR